MVSAAHAVPRSHDRYQVRSRALRSFLKRPGSKRRSDAALRHETVTRDASVPYAYLVPVVPGADGAA